MCGESQETPTNYVMLLSIGVFELCIPLKSISLFKDKNLKSFRYEVSQLSKHTNIAYPCCTTKPLDCLMWYIVMFGNHL